MKRQKNGKTLFGAVILLLMVVLAGTVAFAAEELTYEDCDLNPRRTYFPLILEKKWAKPNEEHPSAVDIEVSYYPDRFNIRGEPEKRIVTLDEENDWRWTFDENSAVLFAKELDDPQSDKRYKADVQYSSWPVDAQGRYLCTITNSPAYTVTYQWEGQNSSDNDIPLDFRNGTKGPRVVKFEPGEPVEISTQTFGNIEVDELTFPEEMKNVYHSNNQGDYDNEYRFLGWTHVTDANGDPISLYDTGGNLITDIAKAKDFQMPERNIIIYGTWEKLKAEYNVYRIYTVEGGIPDGWPEEAVGTSGIRPGEYMEDGSCKITTTCCPWRPGRGYVYLDTLDLDTLDYTSSRASIRSYYIKDAIRSANGIAYYFSGWFFDQECTRPVGPNSVRMPPRDLTVYGQWKRTTKHTATFRLTEDSSAGIQVPSFASTIEFYAGCGIPNNVFEEGERRNSDGEIIGNSNYSSEGYVFSGWHSSDVTGDTMPARDVTFTGKWEKTSLYHVVFEWSGLPPENSANPPGYGAVYEGGEKLEASELGTYFDSHWSDYNPKPINGTWYYFRGWDLSSLTSSVDPETGKTVYTMPAENVTIHGTWSQRSYRVSYTDGVQNPDDVKVEDRFFYKRGLHYGDSTPEPDKLPEREGYTFVRWVPTDGSYAAWQPTVTECVNYEAQWQRADHHTLTIRYLEKDSKTVLRNPYIIGNLPVGFAYSINSPVIPGYSLTDVEIVSPDEYELMDAGQATVSGVMPGENVEIVVWYQKIPNSHRITYKWTWNNSDYSIWPDDKGNAGPSLPPDDVAEGDSEGKKSFTPDTPPYVPNCLWKYSYREYISGFYDEYEISYVFSGWTDYEYELNGEKKTGKLVNGSFPMPDADVCIIGNWERKDSVYSVQYDWGNLSGLAETLPGTTAYEARTDVSVDTKFIPGYPTKINGKTYRFSGWTSASTDGYGTEEDYNYKPKENVNIESGSFTMPNDNVTIYGSWSLVENPLDTATYTVTWYDAETGEQIPGTTTVERTGTIGKNVAVTQRDKEISGWVFKVDDSRNVQLATLAADGTTALKLYFTKYDETAATYKVIQYEVTDKGLETEKIKPLHTYTLSATAGSEVNADGYKTLEGYTYIENFTGSGENVGVHATVESGTVSKENELVLRLYFTENTEPPSDTAWYQIVHEYYENGVKSVVVEEPALSDFVGTEIDLSVIEKKPTYGGAEYDFTSITPNVNPTLTVEHTQETPLVITLRYDLNTVKYTIVHEYYTNNVPDGEDRLERLGKAGTPVDPNQIIPQTSWNGGEYEWKSTTPNISVTLESGMEALTITLRYERTVTEPTPDPEPVRYTVVHEYYTNDKLDGSFTEVKEGNIGDTINPNDTSLQRTTWNAVEYTFESVNSTGSLTLTADSPLTITLIYKRTVEDPDPDNPDSVSYTIIHEYYTNTTQFDGSIRMVQKGIDGQRVNPAGITQEPRFAGNEYVFTSVTPDAEQTLAKNGSPLTITLRYDRTVETPTPDPATVNYTIIHKYFTNTTLDGQDTFQKSGKVGESIDPSTIERLPTWSNRTYTFESVSPDATQTLVEGTTLTIILTYRRTNTPVTPVTYTVIYRNDGVDDSYPNLRENSDTPTVPKPEKPGYRFVGWQLMTGENAEGNTPGDPRSTVQDTDADGNNQIIYKAIWEPELYTVRYTWSGLPVGLATPPADRSYGVNESVTVDISFNSSSSRRDRWGTEYTFSGWNSWTEGGYVPTNFPMPARNVTISGTWTWTPYVPDFPWEWPDDPDPTPPTPTPTPDPEPEPEPEPKPTPEPDPVPALPDRPVDPFTGMVPYDPTVILDDLVPLAAPHLNITDHYAYIIGYSDGLVRPEGNITRAEVATIFFRLMLDEYRLENWATENDFPDVNAGDWYNNAISTCARAGIIKGYEDGTFRPNATITRAEFAAIAARFVSDDVPGYDYFTDMDGHWAQIDVARAVMAGWIKGEGRLFRPEDQLTRAETATMVNRMINRFPDKEHLLPDMIIWPDNPQPPEEKWYYEDIQEATNSHDYEMVEFEFKEIWTILLANRDWAALEKEWADAAAAPGGEVAPDLRPGDSGSEDEPQDITDILGDIFG